MIMKRKYKSLLTLVMMAILLLACNKAAYDNKININRNDVEESPRAGGVVTFGYATSFKGLFEPAFYDSEDDYNVLEFITEPMFKVDDNLITVPNIASWQESDDHTVFTFKIKPGIRWHNGDELTVEDWKFAIETIANPDYTGSRYYSVQMIQGAEDYHERRAKAISGLKVIDPYTLRVTVTAARVNTIDNIWPYPMNKKYYTGVEVKDMPNSDQMLKHPIGIGPFKVADIQPGEKVEMKRFDQYYKGKALLDGITYKKFDEKDIINNFEQGQIDIEAAPRDAYQNLMKLENINVLQTAEIGYEYIGFKFGHWDADAEKIVMDNPKFEDKRLRQAMYYALDRENIINTYSHGLGDPVETPISSASWAKIPDTEINTYPYNPEKAKELLDEAGFVDIDGDGLREDQKGKKLIIHFDSMQGNQSSMQRIEAIIEYWRAVGLDVQLNGGALKDLHSFYDAVESDDPSVELFNGVWGLASDPDPTGLWRENDLWNYPRWTSELNEELIREGISMKAYDRDYRKEVYYKWQKLVNEMVPMIFFAERKTIVPVNKRLQGVKINSISTVIDPEKWWIKEDSEKK